MTDPEPPTGGARCQVGDGGTLCPDLAVTVTLVDLGDDLMEVPTCQAHHDAIAAEQG